MGIERALAKPVDLPINHNEAPGPLSTESSSPGRIKEVKSTRMTSRAIEDRGTPTDLSKRKTGLFDYAEQIERSITRNRSELGFAENIDDEIEIDVKEIRQYCKDQISSAKKEMKERFRSDKELFAKLHDDMRSRLSDVPSLLSGGFKDDGELKDKAEEAVNLNTILTIGVEIIDDFWDQDLKNVDRISGDLKSEFEGMVNDINADPSRSKESKKTAVDEINLFLEKLSKFKEEILGGINNFYDIKKRVAESLQEDKMNSVRFPIVSYLASMVYGIKLVLAGQPVISPSVQYRNMMIDIFSKNKMFREGLTEKVSEIVNIENARDGNESSRQDIQRLTDEIKKMQASWEQDVLTFEETVYGSLDDAIEIDSLIEKGKDLVQEGDDGIKSILGQIKSCHENNNPCQIQSSLLTRDLTDTTTERPTPLMPEAETLPKRHKRHNRNKETDHHREGRSVHDNIRAVASVGQSIEENTELRKQIEAKGVQASLVAANEQDEGIEFSAATSGGSRPGNFLLDFAGSTFGFLSRLYSLRLPDNTYNGLADAGMEQQLSSGAQPNQKSFKSPDTEGIEENSDKISSMGISDAKSSTPALVKGAFKEFTEHYSGKAPLSASTDPVNAGSVKIPVAKTLLAGDAPAIMNMNTNGSSGNVTNTVQPNCNNMMNLGNLEALGLIVSAYTGEAKQSARKVQLSEVATVQNNPAGNLAANTASIASKLHSEVFEQLIFSAELSSPDTNWMAEELLNMAIVQEYYELHPKQPDEPPGEFLTDVLYSRTLSRQNASNTFERNDDGELQIQGSTPVKGSLFFRDDGQPIEGKPREFVTLMLRAMARDCRKWAGQSTAMSVTGNIRGDDIDQELEEQICKVLPDSSPRDRGIIYRAMRYKEQQKATLRQRVNSLLSWSNREGAIKEMQTLLKTVGQPRCLPSYPKVTEPVIKDFSCGNYAQAEKLFLKLSISDIRDSLKALYDQPDICTVDQSGDVYDEMVGRLSAMIGYEHKDPKASHFSKGFRSTYLENEYRDMMGIRQQSQEALLKQRAWELMSYLYGAKVCAPQELANLTNSLLRRIYSEKLTSDHDQAWLLSKVIIDQLGPRAPACYVKSPDPFGIGLKAPYKACQYEGPQVDAKIRQFTKINKAVSRIYPKVFGQNIDKDLQEEIINSVSITCLRDQKQRKESKIIPDEFIRHLLRSEMKERVLNSFG